MNDIRLQATMIIWGAVAAILIFVAGDNIVPLAFLLGGAATVSTAVIWDTASKAMAHGAQTLDESTKHKRSNRTQRLIEKLDEDEIVDLEDLLAARREERLVDSE